MADTMGRGTHPTRELRGEGLSRLDQSEHEAPEPLNPVVGWSIALLISLALWWGVWVVVWSENTSSR
jgi:hypothetical protein